jgi:hypothetical protein
MQNLFTDLLQMRATNLIIAAALFIAAPLAAQNTGVAVGTRRAAVRVEANMSIPTYVRAAESVTMTETWKGTGFVEMLATYTVRGNTRWELSATLPEGVTVLDRDGNWTADNAIIGEGDATNAAAITVRVRVTTAAAATWKNDLRIEADRAL